MHGKHQAVVERRIAAAQEAAARLGSAGSMPWDDIRSAYERPTRSVYKSYGSVLGAALALFTVLWVIGVGLTFTSMAYERDASNASVQEYKSPLATQDEKERFRRQILALGVVCAGAALLGTAVNRHIELFVGFPTRSTDRLITSALELVPACAEVATAPPGNARREALDRVNKGATLLQQEIARSARKRGGIRHFGGDDSILKSHARKVRAAVAVELSRAISEREEAARALGGHALHIATAQAQSRYGMLLTPEALPADPGPDAVDGRSMVKVLAVGAIAALAALPVVLMIGASGSAVLFATLAVFVVAAVVSAAVTGDLHRLGPLVRTVRGDRNSG
ncbi:hypothetical protein ABZ502_30180 [Streptomyces abikoensis]|uniref:hypothetical protein n=1 Tax=Streptomyces abikoensis TaxID=97398 RepID=UPI0033D3AAD6